MTEELNPEQNLDAADSSLNDESGSNDAVETEVSSIFASKEEPQQIDATSWQKDARYESMWKKDPEGLYKSYRELEKTYEPLKKKSSEYESKMQEFEKREQEFGQYQEILDFVKLVAAHPQLSGSLKDYVNQTISALNREKYGDLPPEVMEHIRRSEMLEQKLAEKERAETIQREEKLIESNITDIKSFCEKNGIKFMDQDEEAFIKYCIQNDIPTRFMPQVFKDLVMEKIISRTKETSKSSVIKNIQANSKKSFAPAESRSIPAPSLSTTDKMKQAILKSLKGA